MVDGEAWVRIGTKEVLGAIQKHPLWQGRHKLPKGEGVGVGVGVWPGGKEPAAAVCRLEARRHPDDHHGRRGHDGRRVGLRHDRGRCVRDRRLQGQRRRDRYGRARPARR